MTSYLNEPSYLNPEYHTSTSPDTDEHDYEPLSFAETLVRKNEPADTTVIYDYEPRSVADISVQKKV